MKAVEYQAILGQLQALNVSQIKHLQESLSSLNGKKEIAQILSEQQLPNCPYCKSVYFNRNGFRNDLQRYVCKTCRRTFNELTGTPLARLRKKGRWGKFAQAMIEGLSVRAAAESCGVHKNTSFRWRHRFLTLIKEVAPEALRGIVEFDEIYFNYSEKGARKRKEASSQETSKKEESRTPPKKVCVLVARDRHQDTFDKILESFDYKLLDATISSKIAKDSLVCSDIKKTYVDFTRKHQLRHGKLDLSNGITTVKEIVHIQNVQDYHRKLNVWMERFRGVATKYLDAYLGWFRNLDEFSMNLTYPELIRRAKLHHRYLHQP